MNFILFCKISNKHKKTDKHRASWVLLDIKFYIFQYALAYACLKLVNYSFFFWLPYYLHNKYGWKETVADDISIWYDVGGIIGKRFLLLFNGHVCLHVKVKFVYILRSGGPRNVSHLYKINKRK